MRRALARSSSTGESVLNLKMMKAGFLCLALCAAVAPNAHAQMTWTDRGFVNVTLGVQAGSHDLATSTTFDLYDEQATVESSQKVKGGGFFDVSAGYKVRRNLVAGIGYSRSGSKSDAAINALIPDPRLFDQLRAASTSATDLKHSENALHLFAAWMVPVTDKIDVAVSAGPTVFFVTQDLPGALAVTEPGPTISDVAVTQADPTTVGLNIGVDVMYLVGKKWGVGGLARYTWGSVNLDGASDKLTVGGFQIGGGFRMRF
jgi:outer membrane protein with beta-barrel domain